MSEIKLKPCPFCGGEARLQRKNKKHGYYVICKKCGCRTPYFQYQFDSLEKLRETAIETWNTRRPVERALERLKDENMNRVDMACMTMDVFVDGQVSGLERAIEIIEEEVG